MRKREGSDPDSMERAEPDPVDSIKHPFDLMVASFVEHDSSSRRREKFQARRTGTNSLGSEIETFPEAGDCFSGNGTVSLDEVFFFDLVCRCRQGFGPCSIIA